MPLTDEQRRQAAQVLAHKAVGTSPPPPAAPPPKQGPFAKKRAAGGQGSGGPPAAHHLAFLEGFSRLVVAAMTDQGKTLDSLHFDGAIDAPGRQLLERVRRVFIEAQSSADDRAKAAAAWPAVEAELHQATAAARQAGVPAGTVDGVEDNIAAAADAYIHVRRKGPRQIETDVGYEELLTGLEGLLTVVDHGSDPGARRAALAGVKFGPDLAQRHLDLLERLRHLLVLARTPGHGHQAVAAWDAWFGDINYVLKRMGEIEEVDKTTRARRQDIIRSLNRVHQDVVLDAAYQESHDQAAAQVKMPQPSAPRDRQRLREAVESLEKADELRKKADELTTKSILQAAAGSKEGDVELMGQIFELVHGGVEIDHLLDELKKKKGVDQWITVGELVDKITSTAHTLEEFTFTYLETHAEAQAAHFLETGAEEMAEHWEKIGKWAKSTGEALKVVGTIATVVTVAVSAVKVVRYLLEGKIEEAVKEAVSTAIGVGAGMVAGAAGTAFFAGIAFGIETEIEGLKGAAAMIAYCREENRKSAIGSFYNVIDGFAGEAKDFVADLKVLGNPADRQEWPKAQANLASYAQWWGVCLKRLNGQMDHDRKDVIGGQPEFLEELGTEAVNIMLAGVPASTYEEMAQQVHTLLVGATMLSYHLAEQAKAEDDKSQAEARAAQEDDD
jgi:hypothetical protein